MNLVYTTSQIKFELTIVKEGGDEFVNIYSPGGNTIDDYLLSLFRNDSKQYNEHLDRVNKKKND